VLFRDPDPNGERFMTVLVTGGAGYIGSHMVLELLDHGFDVAVLDNLSTGCRAAVPSSAEFIPGDIADSELVDDICRQHSIDSVLHFAGSTSVPESVDDPLLYYRNNTEGTRSLIDSLLRRSVEKIVFSSTAAVYGSCGKEPISETAVCQPVAPYGWSKLMAEQILQDVAAAHGIQVAILRYFNVAGADAAGRTGQRTQNANSLIKVACEVAVGKRNILEIYGDDYNTPDGTCIRDFIHVSDLVCAHRLALEALSTKSEILICNLGYGKGNSVGEIASAVGKAAGRALPVKIKPRRRGDLAAVVSQPDLAKKVLGWKPAYDDIEYIVKTAFDWEVSLDR
jgi:UDP-glucose 4-epimerase